MHDLTLRTNKSQVQATLDSEVSAAKQLSRRISEEIRSAQQLRHNLANETKHAQQLQQEHQVAITSTIDLQAKLDVEAAHAQRLSDQLDADAAHSRKVLASEAANARHLREELEQQESQFGRHEARLQRSLAQQRDLSEGFEATSLKRERECAFLQQEQVEMHEDAAAEIAEVSGLYMFGVEILMADNLNGVEVQCGVGRYKFEI